MVNIERLLRSAKSSAPKEPYCPDTGDIIWIDFDPQAGREMAGRHAALVVSPRKYNEFARLDRKSTRLNSSHQHRSRMPSSA